MVIVENKYQTPMKRPAPGLKTGGVSNSKQIGGSKVGGGAPPRDQDEWFGNEMGGATDEDNPEEYIY
jgi:hypothetical protein